MLFSGGYPAHDASGYLGHDLYRHVQIHVYIYIYIYIYGNFGQYWHSNRAVSKFARCQEEWPGVLVGGSTPPWLHMGPGGPLEICLCFGCSSRSSTMLLGLQSSWKVNPNCGPKWPQSRSNHCRCSLPNRWYCRLVAKPGCWEIGFRYITTTKDKRTYYM